MWLPTVPRRDLEGVEPKRRDGSSPAVKTRSSSMPGPAGEPAVVVERRVDGLEDEEGTPWSRQSCSHSARRCWSCRSRW